MDLPTVSDAQHPGGDDDGDKEATVTPAEDGRRQPLDHVNLPPGRDEWRVGGTSGFGFGAKAVSPDLGKRPKRDVEKGAGGEDK